MAVSSELISMISPNEPNIANLATKIQIDSKAGETIQSGNKGGWFCQINLFAKLLFWGSENRPRWK